MLWWIILTSSHRSKLHKIISDYIITEKVTSHHLHGNSCYESSLEQINESICRNTTWCPKKLVIHCFCRPTWLSWCQLKTMCWNNFFTDRDTTIQLTLTKQWSWRITNLESVKGPAPPRTERRVDLPTPCGPMTPTTKKSVWSRSI